VLLSNRVLKSPAASFSCAPLGKVNLTALLSTSPTQTIFPLDQTGTPSGLDGFFHFTCSTMEGPASMIMERNWDSFSPRQSPVLFTMSSICPEAEPSLGTEEGVVI
jgi:hypothetical protein